VNGNSNYNGVNEFSEKSSIENSEKLLRTVNVAQMAIDSANVGIWVINTTTKNFIPSSRTKQLFGYDPGEEMSFMDAMQQVLEKYRQNATAAIENALKNQTNLYIEYPVTGFNDHQLRWLSITGGFSNAAMTDNYFSGIVMDITEQKQNELKRSKFIGMVSHELKTPLTALKAYIQMLGSWAKQQKDSFSINALSKVDKQVRKMLNMINSLLNLSGAEVGKIHINKQPFNLDELIEEVIEETLFVTQSHTITMVPCDNILVDADRDKIEQVLINLISNAAKYSDNEAPIEIGCAVKEKMVEVGIKDHGLGIAKKDINKLFMPHYRVESKETEKIPGFGIGLYLCSEIINRHEGRIWVESKLGEGSTFKFTLALAANSKLTTA
jgi:PAS domain S-box-containing protein